MRTPLFSVQCAIHSSMSPPITEGVITRTTAPAALANQHYQFACSLFFDEKIDSRSQKSYFVMKLARLDGLRWHSIFCMRKQLKSS